jgi:lipoate synthase
MGGNIRSEISVFVGVYFDPTNKHIAVQLSRSFEDFTDFENIARKLLCTQVMGLENVDLSTFVDVYTDFDAFNSGNQSPTYKQVMEIKKKYET